MTPRGESHSLRALIAIAYPDETIAGQAAEELERRADDLRIDPDAIGVIICERDWSCRLIARHHHGATTAWSKFWGELLGVLMGQAEMSGIPAWSEKRIRALVTPGTSILFVVSGGETSEGAVEALSQYGGTTLSCPLALDFTLLG